MKPSHTLYLVCVIALLGASASAQQSFRLSSKFYEAKFSNNQTAWDGQHRFGDVFCLKFPRAADAEARAEAMYNNNSLYYSRVAYHDLTSIYVVTSTVPAGRSVGIEIENLAAQNQKTVQAFPKNFSQRLSDSTLGPSLTLIVRNAKEGDKDGPFPFVRPFDSQADAPLGSISVHRLFVHQRDRIEVAGLRYFSVPVSAEQETRAISELSALVEQAADSIQSCTASLPPRVPK
jgi:hypothetical protein